MLCASYPLNISYLMIYPPLPVLQKLIWNFKYSFPLPVGSKLCQWLCRRKSFSFWLWCSLGRLTLTPKPCNVRVPGTQHQATSPTTPLGKVTWQNVSMGHRSVHSFLLYPIELISCKFKREGFSQIPPAPHHSDSFACMAMSAGKRYSFQPWQNGEWDGLFHRILVEVSTHLLFPYASEFS